MKRSIKNILLHYCQENILIQIYFYFLWKDCNCKIIIKIGKTKKTKNYSNIWKKNNDRILNENEGVFHVNVFRFWWLQLAFYLTTFHVSEKWFLFCIIIINWKKKFQTLSCKFSITFACVFAFLGSFQCSFALNMLGYVHIFPFLNLAKNIFTLI